jgi:hypothetical protein
MIYQVDDDLDDNLDDGKHWRRLSLVAVARVY